jgi:type II secretory pathway pseudopilin PulG
MPVTLCKNKINGQAFTLIEVVVALGLFAAAGVVFLQAINSGLIAIEATSSDQDKARDIRFVLRHVLSKKDRTALLEGGEVTLPDERVASWEAELEPTQTLDLFRVSVRINGLDEAASGPLSAFSIAPQQTPPIQVYVFRQGWYEDSRTREQLLEDKQRAHEQAQALRR